MKRTSPAAAPRLRAHLLEGRQTVLSIQTMLDQAAARRRRVFLLAAAAAIAIYLAGLQLLGFDAGRLVDGLGRLGDMVLLMLPPDPGSWSRALLYLSALGETLAIAFLGTFFAGLAAVPLGMLAARNVVAQRVVHFLSRRGLDSIRGIDTLIWALLWINVVGLGPFAGVLAIFTSDLGTFGKLYSEAIEAADERPAEGVRSSGGAHLQTVRFAILPQVLPLMASQVLYYFESNTRSATIIGIVGAGGIGLHLAEQIRTLEWQQVCFIVLLILAMVSIIDLISERLRFSIIGTARN